MDNFRLAFADLQTEDSWSLSEPTKTSLVNVGMNTARTTSPRACSMFPTEFIRHLSNVFDLWCVDLHYYWTHPWDSLHV